MANIPPGQNRWRLGAVLLLAVTALAACSATDRGGHGTVAAPEPAELDGRPEHGGEVRTKDDNRSTFAVDVDTASYTYSRRLIGDGRLPAPGEVRPEEFINSFSQGYSEPRGDGFAIHADGTRLPHTHRVDRQRQRLLRIGLQTRSEERAERRDANLTFVVDVSGSMAEPGRLDLVRDALHALVDQLRSTDSVAIVAFSSRARVVREMTRVTEKNSLHGAVDDLRPEQSTDLEAGLVLGYRVARDGYRSGATNRVIVLSDGLANTGNTDAAPILAQIKEEARKQITLLGVGVGSEYGDRLMERLADQGDGFVLYVSQRDQARKIFVQRLPAALAVRALDAKVRVTFERDTVESYRLIGYENRAVADRDFRDDTVDGGEVGPGHSVTALYEVRLADRIGAGARLGRVDVRWLDPKTRTPTEANATINLSTVDGDFNRVPAQLRVCYAAGYLAEVLRHGPSAPYVELRDLAEIARDASARTEDPAVTELATMISRAEKLT